MFEIKEYDENVSCRTLEHSRQVFHRALEDGGTYYHVHNPAGEDYDISYKKNNDYYKDLTPAYVRHFEAFPDHRSYDEDDPSTMVMDFLDQFETYTCLHANEYTLAIAHVLLTYTDHEVWFADPRALWFLEANERLHVGEAPRTGKGNVTLVGPLGPTYNSVITDRAADLTVFHSLFTLQWILKGRRKEDIKYVDFPIEKSAGIGGILSMFTRSRRVFEPLGWKVIYNGDYMGKFPVRELTNYFNIHLSVPDATPQNTITLDNMAGMHMSWMFASVSASLTTEIFTDRFRHELEEYYDTVIGTKKALGVLIRGTDYVASKLSGIRKMATVEQMLPTLKEWMARDGYDLIFLATEDQDALNRMRREFGGKLIAVAQERHTLEEFTDVKVLNDLEKKIYSEGEYDDRVIDTTINYIYAMYLLARCDSFIASGQCNGVDMVLGFNENRFRHYYRFTVEPTSVSGEKQKQAPK